MSSKKHHLPGKLEAVLARLCEQANFLTKTKAVKLPYLVDIVAQHAFSEEGGLQIELSGPNTTRLDDDEREVVDFVAETYAGLDAGRLGSLTKALNTHLDLDAWGSNQQAVVDEDAYARLSEGWQHFYNQAPALDFTDRSQWLGTVDDPGELIRKTLRG